MSLRGTSVGGDEAIHLDSGWIATARKAGLAMTMHFEDTP